VAESWGPISNRARLGGLLNGLHDAVLETLEAATGARDDVREMRGQLEQQDQQLRQMAAMLSKLLQQRHEVPIAAPVRVAAPVVVETPTQISPPPAPSRGEGFVVGADFQSARLAEGDAGKLETCPHGRSLLP